MLIAVEVGKQKLKQERRSAFMGSAAGIEFWQTTAIAGQMIFKAYALRSSARWPGPVFAAQQFQPATGKQAHGYRRAKNPGPTVLA